ncbi:MAG: hypothetical protein NTV51_00010 [Verrucomicrobia bacterium]|nr:hypothetical protein [Verrucomicrobiota bacterium]
MRPTSPFARRVSTAKNFCEQFRRSCLSACLAIAILTPAGADTTAKVGALARTMDQCHEHYDVYSDADAPGNHFNVRALIGETPPMIESWSVGPHSGSTCIKASFEASRSQIWGGWYFMVGALSSGSSTPSANWGSLPNAGVDLTGATRLSFWARGEQGGEKVKFFCLGVGRDDQTGRANMPYPESSPQITTGFVTLTRNWTQYSISVRSSNLSYVLGGFGWVTNAPDNANRSITFYLDDIQYDRSDLSSPRFLVSYKTAGSSDFDVTMRSVAFTYDNAVALQAFLSAGETERARLIADAFVYALQNDRYYSDGRLRNGYAGGDLTIPPGWLTNGRSRSVRIPGWTSNSRWLEDDFVVGTSTGNMAWAMLALISYYETIGGATYLDAAKRMGEWIEANVRDPRGAGGYMGGYAGAEPRAVLQRYKSTEHNLDLYAAFVRLHRLTGDAKWLTRATAARTFVLSMWSSAQGAFLTGTDSDGVTPNLSVVPVDTQAWTLLALRDLSSVYWTALDFAEKNHRVGTTWGFDFNTDRDGVWYEGTAQMAVAFMLTGQESKASATLAALQGGVLPDGGIESASLDGLTTGFDVAPGIKWIYYRREHVGATAWGGCSVPMATRNSATCRRGDSPARATPR